MLFIESALAPKLPMEGRDIHHEQRGDGMLIDTTLREGAQLFGAYFDAAAARRIVAGVAEAGVEEMELGWVGRGDVRGLLDFAGKRAPGMATSLWCPAREADVEAAADLGARRINIGVPASDAHREKRLGATRSQLLSLAARVVRRGRELGLEVSVGLEDASRADVAFALKLARAVERAGAFRVRLSDTVGLLTPDETAALVSRFRKRLRIAVAAHCHNDFGMASANACAALAAGAEYADVSLLGVGERSGVAALEEVAAHLSLRRGAAYRLDGLRDLCALVSRETGVAVPRTKPVVGRDIFACESGLHVHGVGRDPALFEPYAPETTGAERKTAVGGKSGRASVRMALEELGLACPESRLPGVLASVRRLAGDLKRPLSSEELLALARKTGAAA